MSSIIAFGFFDGVHIGHAALLNCAKARAAERGAVPAVLTFDAHPDTFVKGERVPLLNSSHDRDYILKRFFGISRVYYVHFNAETMRMLWRDFLDQAVAQYDAAGFVVGEDFRFGSGGEGSAALLRDYCAARKLSCDVIEQIDAQGEPVSSTRIRALVREGEIKAANVLLGHPHLLTDTVRTGFRLGRQMDYPTVNMRFEDGVLVPRRGVYATRILLPEGDCRPAVTNIGVRPTFDKAGTRLTVESHIFDYSADLYGARLCVEFLDFLRPEQAFASAEALRAQISRDAARARAALAGVCFFE